MKHKIPPPVAPKPHINPASPPWSIQQETTDQSIPQQTANSVPVPAEAPVTEVEAAPAPETGAPTTSEIEPTLAPESQIIQHCPEQLGPGNAWKQPESQMEPNTQPETWNEKQPQLQINSAHSVAQPVTQPDPSVRSWDPAPTQGNQQLPVSTWGPNEVQLQVPSQTQPQWITQSQGSSEVQLQVLSKTQSQASWVTQPQTSPPPKHQPQPQSQINSWVPRPNQSTPQAPWSQPYEPALPPVNVWQQDQNQASLDSRCCFFSVVSVHVCIHVYMGSDCVCLHARVSCRTLYVCACVHVFVCDWCHYHCVNCGPAWRHSSGYF